jgi:two-component system, OmpR family, phosphate regulon sensor histidine kinase PhoR
MRSLSPKTIIFTITAIIVLVVATQLFWLVTIYSSEQEALQQDVQRTVRASLIVTVLVLSLLLIGIAMLFFYFYRRRYRQEGQKDFLNNFMHEFKTPLAVIRIAGKVLLNPGIEKQPARMKKYAGIIREQSEQLEQKVNRILEVAVSERKDIVLEKEDTDVNGIVSEAIAFVQPLSEEKGAVIEFTPAAKPLRIHADSMYIRQAVICLLDNSLKYAARPEIKITTGHTDKMCVIAVKDNGIGIDRKYHKLIFRKFYRIPTGNVHNVKGFGIGLNFAKKVIDAHQGKIVVESMPGMGSTFSIHIPLI